MIMFSFVNVNRRESVFYPDKKICLSRVYSHHLDKYFLVMKSYYPKYEGLVSPLSDSLALRPVLSNYVALPYKRQSSVDLFDNSTFRSKIRSFGFPWSLSHASLHKIRSFYSTCKKHYVVVAHRCGNIDEKVLVVFDRYSDSLLLLRDYNYTRIRSLLGDAFQTYSSWYPYVWIEHIGHPISLFSEVSSHVGNYPLGPSWCQYFLCFLKDDVVRDVCFSSIFGFVLKDDINFKKIIHIKDRDDLMSRVR